MEPQQMCSEIIRVYQFAKNGKVREFTAILEEIAPSSACIQLVSPVPEGVVLRFACSGCSHRCEFQGKVVECRHWEGLGYFVRMELDADSQWCAGLYRPEHLFDPASLWAKSVEPEADGSEENEWGASKAERPPRFEDVH